MNSFSVELGADLGHEGAALQAAPPIPHKSVKVCCTPQLVHALRMVRTHHGQSLPHCIISLQQTHDLQETNVLVLISSFAHLHLATKY